jgi:protein TonB
LVDKTIVMKKYFAFLLILFCIISIDAQKDSMRTSEVKAGTDYRKKTSQDKIAEFPGGQSAFMRQIINNFDTSKLARQNLSKARAIAVFDVDTDGSMINLKIESYDNELVKQEFLKALGKIKTKWIPAEQNGVKVKNKMRQPLQFNLD